MQNPSVIRTRPRRTAAGVQTRELPLTFILLVIACACVVAAGFFLAARQHFNSIDYGIKNSKLRDQLQNLEAEKRRLLLAREVALSPVAMRKAAREIGLRQDSDNTQVVAVQAKAPASRTNPEAVQTVKVSQPKPAPAQTMVKTAMSTPATPRQSGETRTRVVDSSRNNRKERTEVAALIRLR